MADHDHGQQGDQETPPAPRGGDASELAGGPVPGGYGRGGWGPAAEPGDGAAIGGNAPAGEGDRMFRWPGSGLPPVFGQPPAGEQAAAGLPQPSDASGPAWPPGGDAGAQPPPAGSGLGTPYPGAPGWPEVPFPPRLTLAPQPPYPEPPAPVPYPLPDDYDAVDDYDAADAYGPADGFGPGVGGGDPADAAQSWPPAGQELDEAGNGAAQATTGAAAAGGTAGPVAAAREPAAPPVAPTTGEPAGEPFRAAPAAAAAPGAMRGGPPGFDGSLPVPREAAETADSLTADLLLPGRRAVPAEGWRRLLYRGSGGLIHAPESAAAQRRRQLVGRACTPVAGGHQRVAVLSLKGGVGKTTTVVGLGATLASLRGDRVIAVDANPDRGTLSDKLRLETAATVRDLLNEREQIRRYADVRAFTTQAASRLEVLASDRDPTVSVAFSEADYVDVAEVLEHYYSICITDCGTGLLHSAMSGVLRLAGQIVLVSSPSVDGARSASATLDWLAAHHYGDLVRRAVVVLSAVRPGGKSTVDMSRLEAHFAARCRAVVRIPYDAHLAEGAELDLEQLSRQAADAYLALAAEVGDAFAPHRQARA